ncbi:MAG: PHP domain-containing protein [Ruminococcaceae bacterium]|nr:PHP domain-containing protein [Oscillospiraceae bacterium]
MKKYLLPENGRFYKANLHGHTTVSDGKQDPAEVKRLYMEKGYSVLAYTDHHVMVPHHDLTDENFVALTGYEFTIHAPDELYKTIGKVCHFNLIAMDPDHNKQELYYENAYESKNEGKLEYDTSYPPCELIYSPENITKIMQKGRELGYFVIYNHPTWSNEHYPEYTNYHGMHAMEICNYSSLMGGYDENNGHQYDDMLRAGERIFCVAADDSHHCVGGKKDDAFGAFVMIKADRLEYKTITDALAAGHFYASQGPEIHALWMEDGQVHLCCSDAKKIFMTTARRKARLVMAPDGETVNEAVFDVAPEDIYVRFTVVDCEGLPAQTNAYFTDELFAE